MTDQLTGFCSGCSSAKTTVFNNIVPILQGHLKDLDVIPE